MSFDLRSVHLSITLLICQLSVLFSTQRRGYAVTTVKLWGRGRQLPCVTLPMYRGDAVSNRVRGNDSLITLRLQLQSLVKTDLHCKSAFLDGPSQLGDECSALQVRIVLPRNSKSPSAS